LFSQNKSPWACGDDSAIETVTGWGALMQCRYLSPVKLLCPAPPHNRVHGHVFNRLFNYGHHIAQCHSHWWLFDENVQRNTPILIFFLKNACVILHCPKYHSSVVMCANRNVLLHPPQLFSRDGSRMFPLIIIFSAHSCVDPR
jgi:hypothetical protein